jgi:hypothetical protein
MMCEQKQLKKCLNGLVKTNVTNYHRNVDTLPASPPN